MAPFLDIRTLSMVMGATIFALGISMIYYKFNRETYPGFGAWTMGTILVSLAFFLIAFRHILPDFITIVVPNALICSGLALFYLGFKFIAGKKGNTYLHSAVVFVLSFVLVPFFTYVTPSVNARISLISFAGALYLFIGARVLVREVQYDLVKLNKLLTVTILLMSSLLVFRGIFFLLPGNTIPNYMSSGVFHGMALLAVIILSMVFVIGLFHLNSQILERDLYREQKQLKESKEKYRRLVEQSLQGLVIAQGNPVRLRFVSKPMEAITGYSQGELENFGPRQLVELIHPEDREMFFRNFEDRLAGNEVPPVHEYRIIHKTKGTRWVELFSSRIEYEDAPATHTVFLDITSRKQAEQRLLKSEKGYRDLFNSIKDLIYTQDLDGRFLSLNPAMGTLFGYEKEVLIGRPASDFMKPEMRPFFKSEYLEKIKAKGFHEGVTSYFTKNGEVIYLEYRSSLVESDDGETYISGSGRDVTERVLSRKEIKRLQNQVVHSQKMEAIGLMAGGVAHDLNNILSGIVSYPELLLMDLPEDSPLRKPIKTIQESGMRAADVVADLLTVARGVATGKEVANLNTLIEGYLNSPEHQKLVETHPSITFERVMVSDLLNISCSPTHIKKTLMNLIRNASEAVEGSGTVTIGAKNQYLDGPLIGYENIRSGEYAVLTVSDNGSGILPQDLERIFEPFYTRKVMGRSGTGLGLAVVWNTVQDHKGYIITTSSAKGTVFELFFPITREDVAAEKEALPLEDYLGHGERILVVDDEEQQREIARALLSKLGYVADVVSSGEEAIEYLKENKADLIVLDMVMPKGLNGRETYKEIIKIRPGQKAIIASGYARTKEVDTTQELGAGKHIKKPYTLEKFGLSIKEELEK